MVMATKGHLQWVIRVYTISHCSLGYKDYTILLSVNKLVARQLSLFIAYQQTDTLYVQAAATDTKEI